MHPQIRMNHPGKCPICGMDLIPLTEYSAEEEANSPDEIKMSEEASKIADIQTLIVSKSNPEKEIHLLGKVKPDERNIAELTARFGGRIEKLYINFTGQQVKKGEPLANIYSPALLSAQKELLEAISYKDNNSEFYNAARNKLKLWDLTDGQIDQIEKEGKTRSYFDILSPITGTVTRRDVAVGDYIKEGNPLFRVTDLSKVWVMFEAYESDLPWVSLNDKVTFTIRSIPGKTFTGKVSFIDPTIDPKTRIASVRVEITNYDNLLKPEMFVDGTITSAVAGNQKDLVIPKTAVLWTGKRSVVYVKVPNRNEPTFRYREITLGPEAGESYVVVGGLKEGEEIAVNGVFKIDAAAQLAGKPSMMNPEGGGGSINKMPGMNMGGGEIGKATRPGANESAADTGRNEKANPEFIKQLTAVYRAYLTMKNDFVQSDAGKASIAAKTVLANLSKVDMELLTGETHMEWMIYLDPLKKSLDKIVASNDIEIQRQGLADFNLNFYKVIKRFGLSNDTVYYQYCPMAFNSKGAYWLSEILKIKNPYFGNAMLSCGETRDTLKYK
jgi:membrane fusion protein, copper/silver efflux system